VCTSSPDQPRPLRRSRVAARPFVGALLALGLGLAATAAAALEDGADLDITVFTLRITDDNGVVTHILEGERMQQFDALDLQRTDEPRLALLTDGQVDWIWSAPAAVHYPAAYRLVLLGSTQGEQLPGPEQEPMAIETADVTITTDTRQVMTDAPATLIRPGLFMRGTGLHADIPADTLELKNDVRTVYAPESSQEPPP